MSREGRESDKAARERVAGEDVSNIFRGINGGGASTPAAVPTDVMMRLPQITEAAEKHGVPLSLAVGMFSQENGGKATGVSPAGARGIAQLMPGTAQEVGVTNPDDPQQAIPGGVNYLGKMLKKYNGDTTLALMGYNWGPGNVDNWVKSGADPAKIPGETKAYLQRVQGYAQTFDKGSASAGGPPRVTPEGGAAPSTAGVTSDMPPELRSMLAAAAKGGKTDEVIRLAMDFATKKSELELRKEALVPAEVRTADWYIKASPDQRKAYRDELAIKSGMPSWAIGETTPAAVTPVGAGTATPAGVPIAPEGTGIVPTTGKKSDASPFTLPTPTVDPDKLNQIPAEARTTVKAMLEGRMPAPSSFAQAKPYWRAMIEAANQVDPNFDQTSWASRNATRKDFTSGQSAKAVSALNLALGHAEVLAGAFSKLDNFGGIGTPLNAPLNALSDWFGGERPGNAREAVDALASEARKVFAASGGGNLTELQEWQKNFPINGSPEQQAGRLKTFVDLLDSRLVALANQYNRGMGVTSEPVELLDPAARKAYETLSGGRPKEATGYPTGKAPPSAALPQVSTPKQYDSLAPGSQYIAPDGTTRTKK